jgi:hypothetical protein
MVVSKLFEVMPKEASISNSGPPRDLGFRLETESDLLNQLVKIGDYTNHVRKLVEAQYLTDSALTLDKVYVSSRYESANNGSKDVDEFLFAWLNESSGRQIALLGEYGQGKSTAALMFTYRILTGPQPYARIPILIELRGTSPSPIDKEIGQKRASQ